MYFGILYHFWHTIIVSMFLWIESWFKYLLFTCGNTYALRIYYIWLKYSCSIFLYIYHLCDAPVCSILLPNKLVYCYPHHVHWEKYKLVLILVSLYYWDSGHDQWQLGEQRVYFTLKITAYHWRKLDQKLKIGTSDFVLRARYSRFIVICSCASWPSLAPSIQPSFLLACLSSVLCPFSLTSYIPSLYHKQS